VPRLICVSFLYHDSYVCPDSYVCHSCTMTHMCAPTHMCVIHVPWLICVSFMCHDWYVCHSCAMTHMCVIHVPRLICVSFMCHDSYVWHVWRQTDMWLHVWSMAHMWLHGSVWSSIGLGLLRHYASWHMYETPTDHVTCVNESSSGEVVLRWYESWRTHDTHMSHVTRMHASCHTHVTFACLIWRPADVHCFKRKIPHSHISSTVILFSIFRSELAFEWSYTVDLLGSWLLRNSTGTAKSQGVLQYKQISLKVSWLLDSLLIHSSFVSHDAFVSMIHSWFTLPLCLMIHSRFTLPLCLLCVSWCLCVYATLQKA